VVEPVLTCAEWKEIDPVAFPETPIPNRTSDAVPTAVHVAVKIPGVTGVDVRIDTPLSV